MLHIHLHIIRSLGEVMPVNNETNNIYFLNFYRCTVHSDIHRVQSPKAAHLLKLLLQFTLKLVVSYMFRSTTIIREHSIEPA